MRRTFMMTACLVSLALAGCEGHGLKNQDPGTKNSLTAESETTNDRLDSAAKQAIADGNADEALVFYEKLYRQDSRNPETALHYAQVLRKTDNPQRAIFVLAPFVKTEDGKKTSAQKKNADLYAKLRLEHSAATLEVGRFEQAETQLQEMLNSPQSFGLQPQIHNLIGVSLDARGMHDNAEKHYRTAIEDWEGQPITAMNNLALNLAHQGYFDEAMTLLRKAYVMAPERDVIATNIDLISGLKASLPSQQPTSLQ